MARGVFLSFICPGFEDFGSTDGMGVWSCFGRVEKTFFLRHMAMGQNPNRTPSEHPNPH